MKPVVAQSFAAFLGGLGMMSIGMLASWPVFALPKLLHQQSETEDKNEMKITENEGSWVVSIAVFAAMLGPAPMIMMVDRIGRRWSLNGIVLVVSISWLIIGLAKVVELLYVGRFIGGLAMGAAFPVTSMYLGEIAEDRIRGTLGSVLSVSLVVGQLLSLSVGPWIPRPMFSIFAAVPLVVFFIGFHWLPETPYYWLMKGDREKASASLVWLRQRSDVTEELRNVEILVNAEQKNRSGFDVARLFRSPGNRRAFLIILGLMTFQQFCGTHAIIAYAGLIFTESGLTGWNNLSMIILGAFALLAGLGSFFVIDAAGRRPTLMLSSFFVALFLLCEAVFFHLKYLGHDTTTFAWLPLVSLIGFNFAAHPGLAGVPWIMAGEIFPTDVKAVATILLASYGSLAGFLVVKMYEPISSAYGVHCVYYAFAISTFIAVFFVYFVVPETKKRSFEDIQKLLNYGSSEKLEKPTKF